MADHGSTTRLAVVDTTAEHPASSQAAHKAEWVSRQRPSGNLSAGTHVLLDLVCNDPCPILVGRQMEKEIR
jgi:hypothetical protein